MSVAINIKKSTAPSFEVNNLNVLGTVNANSVPLIFGNGFYFNPISTPASTTSATFASINQIITGIVTAGTYMVWAWALGNTTSTTAAIRCQLRCRVDGTVLGPASWNMPLTQHTAGNNAALVTLGTTMFMFPITLTNAAHTINLDSAISTAGQTFTVNNSSLAIWRIS